MITIGVNTGKKPFYNAASFICDFQSDVANLPTNRGVGSTAKVLENGNFYILNSEKQWILQTSSGGGGGGGLPPEDTTIIYDGGVITAEGIDTIIYDGGMINA